MPKEKTVKGETYRNEDKIKRKTRVDNLEDFYNFRMPYKDEAIHAKKSMKILRTVTISSFLPFLAVVLFFLAWNTIHVVMDGHLEKETMQTYIFTLICVICSAIAGAIVEIARATCILRDISSSSLIVIY